MSEDKENSISTTEIPTIGGGMLTIRTFNGIAIMTREDELVAYDGMSRENAQKTLKQQNIDLWAARAKALSLGQSIDP